MRRSAGGRKYGSGYPLPMLAILLFAFFHAKNEEMPKPNAEKKKHRNWGFCQEELFRGREKLYD